MDYFDIYVCMEACKNSKGGGPRIEPCGISQMILLIDSGDWPTATQNVLLIIKYSIKLGTMPEISTHCLRVCDGQYPQWNSNRNCTSTIRTEVVFSNLYRYVR